MRYWESFLNRRFRARLNLALALEAEAAAEPADVRATERLWQRIEARLPAQPQVQPRRHAQAWIVIGGGMAAACAAALALPPKPAARLPQDAGLKDASAMTPSLTNLRFAIVTAGRTVVAGHSDMAVKRGTPLIFSVEAQGVTPDRPLDAVLVYVRERAPGVGNEPVEVTRVHLTHAKESLMQGNEFLAFTPEDVGVYDFFLRTRAPEAGGVAGDAPDNGEQHDVGVRVRIVAP